MASDWIKWVKGLAERREVIVLANVLKIDRLHVAGACMKFWEWADDNTTDGNVEGVTGSFVDALVGLDGFTAAMCDSKVGWLREKSNGFSIPKFSHHNGETAKTRARNAKNQRRRRHRNVTGMSPLSGDKKVTRGEGDRDREEISRELGLEKRNPRDGPSISDSTREKARTTWLARICPLFGKAGDRNDAQLFADKTVAERLFDDLIWPEGLNGTGPDRFRRSLDFIKRSSGRKNRMAWITRVLSNELGDT